MARALTLKLEHEGYDVDTAFDGKEGLEHIDKKKFDLILCDLVMPNVDGFELLQSLKEKKVTTPVVVLSNLGQAEDRQKAEDMGAAEFFIKSNTPIKNIVEHVKKMLA